VIVRTWEAEIVPGRLDEFCEVVRTKIWPQMDHADGFLGGEVYRSYEGPERVLMVSRWRDEDALRDFAGPMWRLRPIVTAYEEPLIARPPNVWHSVPLDLSG
jgi:Antibiotic biosynthesis monooxygenase